MSFVPSKAAAPKLFPPCTKAFEPVTLMNDAVMAYDAVILLIVPAGVVIEFSEALEPDTMTRFHDGILYFLLDCG